MNHAAFIGDIDVRILWRDEAMRGENVRYQVLSPFTFQSSFGDVTAEPGMVIDFASIPQWAQSIVGKEHPAILVGSVPHDVLYASRGLSLGGHAILDRRQSDIVMREAMEAVGSRAAHRSIVFNAVRLGGGKAWRH